jgi:hypothetical protein
MGIKPRILDFNWTENKSKDWNGCLQKYLFQLDKNIYIQNPFKPKKQIGYDEGWDLICQRLKSQETGSRLLTLFC